MDIKLIGITFLSVFIAELGDKTQLAVFSFAAGVSNSKWSIFAGSVLALALASFLAVFFGSYISRYIPVYYLKILSGSIFVIIGAFLLFNSFQEKQNIKNYELFLNQITQCSVSKCSECVKFQNVINSLNASPKLKEDLKSLAVSGKTKTLCFQECKIEELKKKHEKTLKKFG